MAAVDNNEAPAAPEMVKLLSNDGETFTVPRELTKHSVTINNLFRDLGLDSGTTEAIPLPNLKGTVLKKVLEWAEHHRTDALYVEDETREKRTDDINQWDKDFYNVDQPLLFDLLLAANYLDMKALLDTGCKTVANMIKGKSPEEIRTTFNIKNDFTKEEEEQIRRENAWCED